MAITNPNTLTSDALPWDPSSAKPGQLLPHLVLCWCLDEPERTGQITPMDGARVIGRGGAAPGDAAPRAIWYQARPGTTLPQPALRSPRISRSQLLAEPAARGGVRVRRTGRCPLVVGGTEVDAAEIKFGGSFALRNAAIFMVVERPLGLPALRGTEPSSPFGEADADGIVGESPAAWQLREQIAFSAASPHHVLISGESGTGKELVARAIHRLSSRRHGPFVTRNAATLPEGLMDAELFGSARNYPNSGSPERPGLVGEADGGTLFLDEVGELPPMLQAHLLRLLDRGGEYQRLGEARVRRASVRLIGATNRPSSSLKHDLAARFAARITTPPLAERREDVPLLLRHLALAGAEASPHVMGGLLESRGEKRYPRLDPALVEALLHHPFETNTRELERLLWDAVGASRGEFIELPAALARSRTFDVEDVAIEPQADQIRAALESAGGSITKAAQRLGLRNRYALYRLMKRHGIQADEE